MNSDYKEMTYSNNNDDHSSSNSEISMANFGAITINITTLSITTFILTIRSDTQHNGTFAMLSDFYAECHK
jgi:hypothetical protein